MPALSATQPASAELGVVADQRLGSARIQPPMTAQSPMTVPYMHASVRATRTAPTVVAGLAVGRVGALPALDRGGEVELEVRRVREPLGDSPASRRPRARLEHARAGRVASTQGRSTLREAISTGRAHVVIIA